MSFIVILIITILGLFGFSSVEVVEVAPTPTIVEVQSPEWTPVSVGDVDGVIMPGENGAAFGLPDPYWTPSVPDIVATENAISDDQGDLEHLRQYVGFTEDGERKIYVNGFCSDEPNWRSQAILVMDGGECYFAAVYNVDSGELEYFRFNGNA